MASSESTRAVFYALFANLGIAIAKGIAAFYTRSGSMMAETIQTGPYVVLAAKIKLAPGIDIDTACRIINALEQEIKPSVPEVHWSFMEPDIAD